SGPAEQGKDGQGRLIAGQSYAHVRGTGSLFAIDSPEANASGIRRAPYNCVKVRRCVMASTTTVAKRNNKGSQRKYFSLAEARRSLVLVKRVTADIQNTQANRLKLHAALALGTG